MDEKNGHTEDAAPAGKKTKQKKLLRAGRDQASETANTTLFYLHSLLCIGGRLMSGLLNSYNSMFELTSSDKAKIYRNISRQYMNKGHHQRALDTVKEWSRLEPGNPEAHYQLALCLESSGKAKQAIVVLDKVLELSPKRKDALLRKSRLLIKHKRYPEAIESLEAFLGLDADNADALYLLGVTYSRIDDTTKAIQSIKKALEIAPEESKCHQFLGLLYERNGDHKEAAKCFSRVMELEGVDEEDDEDELL